MVMYLFQSYFEMENVGNTTVIKQFLIETSDFLSAFLSYVSLRHPSNEFPKIIQEVGTGTVPYGTYLYYSLLFHQIFFPKVMYDVSIGCFRIFYNNSGREQYSVSQYVRTYVRTLDQIVIF